MWNKRKKEDGFTQPVFKIMRSNGTYKHVTDPRRYKAEQILGIIGFIKPCEQTKNTGCRVKYSKNCEEKGKKARDTARRNGQIEAGVGGTLAALPLFAASAGCAKVIL